MKQKQNYAIVYEFYDMKQQQKTQRLLGRGVSFQRKKGDAPAPAIVIPALLLRVCTAAPAADVL